MVTELIRHFGIVEQIRAAASGRPLLNLLPGDQTASVTESQVRERFELILRRAAL
jgi:hypothetical protein